MWKVWPSRRLQHLSVMWVSLSPSAYSLTEKEDQEEEEVALILTLIFHLVKINEKAHTILYIALVHL